MLPLLLTAPKCQMERLTALVVCQLLAAGGQ